MENEKHEKHVAKLGRSPDFSVCFMLGAVEHTDSGVQIRILG